MLATMADVRNAQDAFHTHVGSHGCRAQECAERLALWNEINRLALLWERSV